MSVEFKLLTGPELNLIDPQGVTWPFDTMGIVAFEDGKLVARTAIMNLPVIEGTWVDPEKRNTFLAARLIQKIEQLYVELGKTHAMALVYDEQPEIEGYLKRFGYEKQPVTFHAKELIPAKKEGVG